MEFNSNENASLKIGDYITIKNLTINSYLCAEGILLEDIVVSNSLSSFEDALFCIHLQRQYSASRELEEFLLTYEVDVNNVEDGNTSKFLKALQRGRDNENKLNESYMKQKIGTPVCFGDVIQLLHVKSGKFVTIIPDQLARDERENIRISLSAEGSTYSWLQILPRYKIDREGDTILSNTEVYFKVSERPNEFIHCSDKPPPTEYSHEVNCSLENTSWKLVCFQNVSDAADPNLLFCSQLVFIHDPETRSNISIFANNEDREDGASTIPTVDDNSEIVIQPASTKGELDTTALWVLESKLTVVGGPVQWKSDLVRFRNLNTGRYLSMENILMEDPSGGTRLVPLLSTTHDIAHPGTLFNVNELFSTATYLSNAKAVQISQSGVWVSRGEYDDSADVYTCVGTRDRNAAVSLLIHRYTEGKEEVGTAVPITEDNRGVIQEPWDVYVGVSARNYLKNTLRRTKIPENSDYSSGTVWPNTDHSELQFFETTMQRINSFAQGYSISCENIALAEKPLDLVRNNRQNMICDQGTLDILMKLLDKLIPISVRLDSVSGSKTLAFKSEEEKAVVRMGQAIIKQCLNLLYHTVLLNPRNQMFVADAMPILLAHVGSQSLAAKCVTDMLATNMELQEEKIGVREITIFTEKLKESSMNSMYLKLLRACCSCLGRGVVGNQITVSEVVFKDISDIIIQVHCDSVRVPVHWNGNKKLYFDGTSPTLGYAMVTDGAPQLFLSWYTSSPGFSSAELFKVDKVPVADLFQPGGAMVADVDDKNRFNDRQMSVFDKKMAVAEYFTSELFLAAEMCLSRNYIAMRSLEPLFPYEALVAMIKMQVNEYLKSAAVNLVLHLYVDRDPQVVSVIPSLTRSWSQVTKNEIPQLPYVEPERRYLFGLLQDVISEHVDQMKGNFWNTLSLYMMQLMYKLVEFNFYGTSERLEDVIDPLIRALDRRKMEVHVHTTEATTMVSGRKRLKGKRSGTPQIRRLRSKNMARVASELSMSALNETVEEDIVKDIEGEERATPWQKKTYDFLDSLSVLLFIILLVVVALAANVVQLLTHSQNAGYKYFEYVVISIFCVEVSLRYYCYVYINNNFHSFFRNILNVIDVGVVIIDLVILGTPQLSGSGAEFAKALRAVRLVRLIRVFRAARLVQKLKDLGAKKHDDWKMPIRYLKTPSHELDTMVAAVNILSYVEKILEDRNLSILLRSFYRWEQGLDKRTPAEIFEDAVESTRELSLVAKRSFDDIFIDNLMFVHPNLVQVVLDVLMAAHSTRSILLKNAKNVQLLVSSKREKQRHEISDMLRKLAHNAETNELWCQQESEEDRLIYNETKTILSRLLDMCRHRRKVLCFNEDYEADTEVQDMLRNLGFMEISLDVLRLLNEYEDDSEIAEDVNHEVVSMCNELFYWFVVGNKKNQALAFSELDFFLGTIDMKIGSHKIFHAIFVDNDELMRACPRYLIGDFTDKVCRIGRRPQYLTLLASITNVGERNILENQYEIVKQLIAPSRLSKMVSFCCPVDDPSYEQKVQLMAPYADVKDIDVFELPHELAYHLEFLRVLSGCTVGRVNITTVEAKVQSVFDYQDIIDAMLDERSLLIVKSRLGLFLFDAIIEVEIIIPGLSQSARLWRLLETFVPIFDDAVEDFRLVEKVGWERSGVSRQKSEYVIVCAMIVSGFFNYCYDPSKIRAEETVSVNDKVQMTMQQVNDLIGALFEKLKSLFDLHSPILNSTHKGYLISSLDGLNKSAGRTLIVDPAMFEMNSASDLLDEEDEDEEMSPSVKVLTQYSVFIKALEEDEEVKELTASENKEFIAKIEKLPSVNENVVADVRYEALIMKLVSHVRDRLEVQDGEKRLDARCTETTTWIIRSFRTMIENRWGMSIYERDEDGGEEEDIAAGPVITALNNCGATTLCLDLISIGIDSGLMLESVKLCVAMLFLEGGNLPVQQTMFNHLQGSNSELFFRQMRISIQKLIEWHNWKDVIILEEDEDVELPEDIIIVRFLQLMCEGHYQPNQDIMREQTCNPTSVNLLDDFVAFLNCLSRIPCKTNTDAATRISATILEVIQGPCEKNQEHFVLNTELVETLNRLMRAKPIRDCDEEAEFELKKTGIDIFQGLLEGQGGNQVVYERVLSVIHLDIIQMMCTPTVDDEDVAVELGEAAATLQTESLVLLQMLCDYKPSLRDELGLQKDAQDVAGSSVACVEILWRGELQRRFFHVPDICRDLAKPSKDNLVENVDRSNLESKLQDFVFRAHDLYREVKHQQVLKEWNVSGIFSRTNQNRATWIAFFLALIINFLLLCYYSASSGEPKLPREVQIVVRALNIFQLVFATFTLILFLVVRVPVKYQSNLAAGYSKTWTVINTATDGLTMYYFMYLIFCLLAINYSDTFVTFLLLDIIVKNSTTRDVLNAVIYPRKQLAMTLVLGLFVMYIFAFVIFFFFRNEMQEEVISDCENLYKCLKTTMSYGVRLPGGIGDQMTHTLGERYLIDLMFFLVVLIVLLNVIFGIIIDTFGDLRAKKLERQHDTTEKCFMCGIDKQVFDRASKVPNGFKIHIRLDHNMWNYLYFIFYIWEQDKDDDDGLEQYVRRSVAMNDIGWFPMNKAMRLDLAKSVEEDMRNEVKSDITAVEKSLYLKLSQLQTEIGDTLDKIAVSVIQTNSEDDMQLSVQDVTVTVSDDNSSNISRRSRSRRETKTRSSRRRKGKSSTVDDSGSCASDTLTEDSGVIAHMDNEVIKSVVIQLNNIENISSTIQSSDLTSTTCQIICETGIYEIERAEFIHGVLKLKPRDVIVTNRSTSADVRACRIQIVRRADGQSQVLAVCDLRYGELITHKGNIMRVEFLRGDETTPSGSILTLSITCSDAQDDMESMDDSMYESSQ